MGRIENLWEEENTMRKSVLSVLFIVAVLFSITACASANPVLVSNTAITEECSNILEAMSVCDILSDCLHESITPADVSITQDNGNEYIEAYLIITDVSFQVQTENLSVTIPSSVLKSWIGKSNSGDTFVAVPNILID